MAFREIGKGFESMKTLSRLMNMTEPINIKAYNATNNHLLEAYLMAADNIMSQTATEVKEISEKQKESTSFPGKNKRYRKGSAASAASNNYIGDGDSSSFNKVVQSKPYGETFIINKLECVRHIQKRLVYRLRTLRQTYKSKKLSDGKGISGKGRLTDRAINLLQNYFGMAIRQNRDVPSMKKAIGAVLFHCSESECDEQCHLFCPRTENSWCKWQSDQITGKETYKTKISLPSAIKTLIKPIFVDLSNALFLKSV